MKAVIQRVESASVSVGGAEIARIGAGLVVLLGVEKGDDEKDADFLLDKIIHLRIFEDGEGKMNRSLADTAGELLVVSQFTLLADCRKGRGLPLRMPRNPRRPRHCTDTCCPGPGRRSRASPRVSFRP